jgi:hypothetical protein
MPGKGKGKNAAAPPKAGPGPAATPTRANMSESLAQANSYQVIMQTEFLRPKSNAKGATKSNVNLLGRVLRKKCQLKQEQNMMGTRAYTFEPPDDQFLPQRVY